MTREEKEIALYCLKASSDYHSEVCEECVKYPNCDHTIQDDVTETIIKALEQESCEDCISRKQAIEEADKLCLETFYDNEKVEEMLSELPSVTPQKPKSEWEHDHEILKAYSNGANEVLDKIYADIQKLRSCSCSCSDGIIDDVEDIIDKYKAESEG